MRLFDAGARDDRPAVVHDRVLTVANAITAARLAGLPLFVWLLVSERAYGAAVVALVVIACTDWIDGYVARRFDQVTRIGRLLDPLIDRLLLGTVAVTFLVVGFLPWFVVALVVLRDALLLAVAGIIYRGAPTIPVSNLGKFATASLLVGIPSFLPANMDWAGRGVFLALAVAFSTVGIAAYYAAGVGYAREVLREHRALRRG